MTDFTYPKETTMTTYTAEDGVRVSEHLSEQSDPSVTMSEGEK